MGDHAFATMALESRRFDKADSLDVLLVEEELHLDEDSINWISNHIDCFVSQCQGNESVEEVHLCRNAPFNGHDGGDVCDKIGEAIGNLPKLKALHISLPHDYYDEDDYYYPDDDDDYEVERPVPILDWEMLARILRHVRQSVTVYIDDNRLRTIEEVQPFARAICGHPFITSFEDSGRFPYESLDTLFSTLTTLPALKSVSFGAPGVRQADESTLASPESLTELLRVPSLRYVSFKQFSFTSALFQATANALMEGTAIAHLRFTSCWFSKIECGVMMANCLSRNTSVVHISVVLCYKTRALFDALAGALPSNSTLQHLTLKQQDAGCWLPVFSALRQNTGLKKLTLYDFGLIDESLCTAMKYGLGLNATLEKLDFYNVPLHDENAALWCSAFSFLRTSKTLKSLHITLENDNSDSCVSTLLSDIACMLQDNASLESLSIFCCWRSEIKAEEHIAILTALQHNTTLNTFQFYHNGRLQLTDGEDKQMVSLLKKNYALESLPDIGWAGDVGAILRLNAAGRRYLVQDESSIYKGVEVLNAVSKEINCVFLHLLENPRLCDRSAIATVSHGTDNVGSTSPVNHIEMREHDRAQNEGKESRRRLT
jgi:hypothetical protein